MASNQSVFVPDQSHHDNVEDRQHDETDAVRVREAIELVDDEETKDDKRNRIGPELISKQTDNEEHLNDAVAEAFRFSLPSLSPNGGARSIGRMSGIPALPPGCPF